MGKISFRRKAFWVEAKNVALLLFGSVVLAFGSAAFITPCNIVSGGVVSIGIILNHYIEPLVGFPIYDIVLAVVQVALWLLGLVFVGQKFSMRTLLATLAYPAFYSLFLHIHIDELLGFSILSAEPTNYANLLIAALFGGFLTGSGVAISYLGNGSTGGLDIVSRIVAKWTPIREDISTLAMDSTLVIVGFIVMQEAIPALLGILSAVVCASAIQIIYIRGSSAVICDVISDKWEEIMAIVHAELDHATTIIDSVGGYTGEQRKLLRIVVKSSEVSELRGVIAKLDERAFLTLTTAKAIHGEGFEPLKRGQVEETENVFKLFRKKDKDTDGK